MTDDRIASRVASRFIEAKEPIIEDFERAVDAALSVHAKFQKWLDAFPKKLRMAIEVSSAMGLPDGRVAMGPIYDVLNDRQGYNTLTWKTMRPLADRIERLGWDLGLDDYLTPIINSLTIGGESDRSSIGVWQFTHGEFTERHDIDGKLVISFDVDRVENWVKKLKKWSAGWPPVIKKALKGAKKSYQRKSR